MRNTRRIEPVRISILRNLTRIQMMWKIRSNDYKESFVKTDVVSIDKKTTVLLSLKKLALF